MESTPVIRLYDGEAEARAAAEIMASTDPWITLGSNADKTYRSVTNPNFESWVALIDGQVVGIILLAINIPVARGYVAALAVHGNYRNRGIGAQLLSFAEARIGETSPNVFLSVSSFNHDA